MIYEDFFSIPKTFINNRVSFLGESRNAQSPVRIKFSCRAITHTVCTV